MPNFAFVPVTDPNSKWEAREYSGHDEKCKKIKMCPNWGWAVASTHGRSYLDPSMLVNVSRANVMIFLTFLTSVLEILLRDSAIFQ